MLSQLRTLWEVFKHLFTRMETVQYPEQMPYMAPRYRGRIVLTRDPDAYLYSSLAAASIYLVDDQRAAGFEALAERAIEEIKLDEQRARVGGAPAMRSNYGELT